MALTINQIAALTTLLCNEEISRNQIGSIIGLSRQSTHRNKDKELDEKDILKIEEEGGCVDGIIDADGDAEDDFGDWTECGFYDSWSDRV